MIKDGQPRISTFERFDANDKLVIKQKYDYRADGTLSHLQQIEGTGERFEVDFNGEDTNGRPESG